MRDLQLSEWTSTGPTHFSQDVGPLQERRQCVLQRHQPRWHGRGLKCLRRYHPGGWRSRHRKRAFGIVVIVIRWALGCKPVSVVGRVEGEGQVRIPATGVPAALHWRGNSGTVYSTTLKKLYTNLGGFLFKLEKVSIVNITRRVGWIVSWSMPGLGSWCKSLKSFYLLLG